MPSCGQCHKNKNEDDFYDSVKNKYFASCNNCRTNKRDRARAENTKITEKKASNEEPKQQDSSTKAIIIAILVGIGTVYFMGKSPPASQLNNTITRATRM